MPVYQSYAIFSECTGGDLNPKLETEEMKPGLPSRVFNKLEAFGGEKAIAIADPGTCKRISLLNGTYHINGVSFLSMLRSGKPPVPPVPVYNLTDIYPGYCILYRSDKPPVFSPVPDMSSVVCFGTMGTAYDSGPSIFECVLEVNEPSGKLDISLGHQCSYENHTPEDAKAYLRIGGSDFHICARISIFKIA